MERETFISTTVLRFDQQEISPDMAMSFNQGIGCLVCDSWTSNNLYKVLQSGLCFCSSNSLTQLRLQISWISWFLFTFSRAQNSKSSFNFLFFLFIFERFSHCQIWTEVLVLSNERFACSKKTWARKDKFIPFGQERRENSFFLSVTNSRSMLLSKFANLTVKGYRGVGGLLLDKSVIVTPWLHVFTPPSASQAPVILYTSPFAPFSPS